MSNLIGIVYSPGFGAGWSTWGSASNDQALDQELATAVEQGQPFSKLLEIAQKNWPDAFPDGLVDAVVVWVEPGTRFRIDEYDGSESLILDDDWMVAELKGEKQ